MDQLVIKHQLNCIAQSKKFLLNMSTLIYQKPLKNDIIVFTSTKNNRC